MMAIAIMMMAIAIMIMKAIMVLNLSPIYLFSFRPLGGFTKISSSLYAFIFLLTIQLHLCLYDYAARLKLNEVKTLSDFLLGSQLLQFLQ